ncbi:MAG: trigger factor [Planctomycetota bacterium]
MNEAADEDVAIEVLTEGPCQRRFKTIVSAQRVQADLNKNYQQLRNQVKLPGFRPGKVPRSVLEKRFAKDVEKDVREDLMRVVFGEEIKKQELRVLGEPEFDKVEFAVGAPFRFEVVFEVFPEFQLGDYKGLTIEARPVVVTDAEVAEELSRLRENAASFEPLEFGSQADGDFCDVDMELPFAADGTAAGPDDASAATRHTQPDVRLKIGDDRVDNWNVPGLSNWLKRAGVDAKETFQVLFPEDFALASLAGKTGPVTLTARKVWRRVVPASGLEVAEHYGLETAEKLQETVRQSLESRRKHEEERRQEEEILGRVADAVEMDLPTTLIARHKSEINYQDEIRQSRAGKTRGEIEALRDADTELDARARREIKRMLVLDQIAEQERVFVTEDDVRRRLDDIASALGRNPAELAEDYRERGLLPELRSSLQREKVRRLLRKKSTIKEEAAAPSASSIDTNVGTGA